jgi:hypothetical protein
MGRWSDRGAGTMTLWMYPHVPGRLRPGQRPSCTDGRSGNLDITALAAIPAKESEYDRDMASRLGRDGGGSRLFDVCEGPAR